MNAAIHEQLKKLAPHVRFETSRELDESFVWDGDGPDPIDEGYEPYDVTVRVFIVHSGEVLDAYSHLGGSYYLPDEEIGDIHGYLPQMLQEAVREVMESNELLPRDSQYRELEVADRFLTDEMQRRYDEQQKSAPCLWG